MQSTRAKKTFAPILALLATLTFAAPAFAASTSSGVSEQFTIAASVTVANVPSTGTFASPPACQAQFHVAACLATDYSYNFTSTIGTNNGSGLTVQVLATPLTAGASTIPLSARGLVWNVPAGFTTATTSDTGHFGELDATNAFALGSTSAQGSVALSIEPLLRVDPNAFPAGNYQGTFTVRATTNP